MTVEQVLKLTGAAMVIAGSAGYGVWMSGRWKAHLALLENLRKMIFLLKGEILYANAPLEEAFLRVGEKSQGALGELFVGVAKRIEAQRGEPFYDMWQDEIDKLDRQTPFSEKDRRDLKAFGEHLGYLDAGMQERTILLYLEQLDMVIGYLRDNQRDRSRLYTSLGLMGGIFLAIILY